MKEKRERMYRRVKEFSKHELEIAYMELWEAFTYFENYLIKEFGKEEYLRLVKESAKDMSVDMLNDLGMDKNGIDYFLEKMERIEEKENELN